MKDEDLELFKKAAEMYGRLCLSQAPPFWDVVIIVEDATRRDHIRTVSNLPPKRIQAALVHLLKQYDERYGKVETH